MTGRSCLCILWSLAAALGLAGCAGGPPPPCGYPQEIAYADQADSLGLADFRALPVIAQQERREEAARWRVRADQAGRASARLAALGTAAGLAPDDARTWLALAELNRWLGDRDRARDCLEAFEAALAYAPAAELDHLRLRGALQRGWLHRDRGEWSWGLGWADTAASILPSDRETWLLRGLLLGQRGETSRSLLVARDLERSDPLLSAWVWVTGVASLGAEALPEAVHWLTGGPRAPLRRIAGSQLPSSAPRQGDPSEASRYAATPDALHRTDYWSDLGLACERLGRWDDARRSYSRGFQSLPVTDASCLRRLDLPVREGGVAAPTLPVWLAFDRFFVTGSWWAYALEAAARYEGASEAGRRQFWSDAAVGALSVCIRKGLSPAEARAVRGRVYVQLEAYGLAEADLVRARDELRAGGRVDARAAYWLGYLKVKGAQHREAVPFLREAVAADSLWAPGWTTLGYALVMTGDLAGASSALDRALALDPRQTAAWYNRGLMHFNAEQWEEAASDLRRAAELAPDSADIANLLRRVILQLQRLRRQGVGS